MLLAISAPALAQPNTHHPRCSQGARDSVSFIESVWSKERWRRGDPKQTTIEAWHRNARCAGKKGRKFWRHARAEFYKHRKAMIWRERITPFYGCTPYGGCGWYSLPVLLVICESGGNYEFPYGAYSILDPAWHAWGGKTAHAGEASKHEQDLVAAHGWDLYGEGAWECGSDGLAHPERF